MSSKVAATAHSPSGKPWRALMTPAVVVSVTLAVRLCVYFLLLQHSPITAFLSPHVDRPSTAAGAPTSTNLSGRVAPLYYAHGTGAEMAAPPHLHFSIWNPSTAPATWKDTLFWRDAIGSSTTPAYLSSVMAWYTPYLPAALARQPLSGVWLCLCDALTALLVSSWPSCTPGLLYGFFIFNPVCIVATVFESLVALDILLLCVAVNMAHVHGARAVLATAAGLLACALLGVEFMALPVTAFYPIHSLLMKERVFAGVLAVGAAGAGAALHMYVRRHDARDAAIYVPPENSPMWYVRESILSVFYRSFEAMFQQLPTIVSVLILVYLPPFERPGAAHTDRSAAFQPLFPSSRVAAIVFAVLLSLVFRGTSTLPYWSVAVLILYASLNPLASKPVRRQDGTVVVRSVWMRTRILVPIYTAAMSIPLEITFYGGWALRETSNPNWIFFAQIGYSAAGIMFVCVWLNELVNDLLEMEWLQGQLREPTRTGSPSPAVATK